MKYSLLCLSLLVSTGALAKGDGAYLGFLAGVESVNSEVETSSVSASTLGSDGGSFGLYTGYQFSLSPNTLMGVEAEYKLHTTELMQSDSDVENSLSMDASYSFSTTLTYRFSKYVHLSGRVGLTQAEVELLDSSSVTSNEKLLGVLAGVGVTFYNDTNMALRLEYRYSDYGSENLFEHDDTTEDGLTSHSVLLGIEYHF